MCRLQTLRRNQLTALALPKLNFLAQCIYDALSIGICAVDNDGYWDIKGHVPKCVTNGYTGSPINPAPGETLRWTSKKHTANTIGGDGYEDSIDHWCIVGIRKTSCWEIAG